MDVRFELPAKQVINLSQLDEELKQVLPTVFGVSYSTDGILIVHCTEEEKDEAALRARIEPLVAAHRPREERREEDAPPLTLTLTELLTAVQALVQRVAALEARVYQLPESRDL
jgi:hypothetical protein